MDPIVIIGSGLAGYGVAREFRKLDESSPLLVVTRDSGDAVYKPNLSKALAAGKTADDLIQTPVSEMAERLNATITPMFDVERIDTADKQLVQRGNGDRLSYSKLVLATGARPIRLPLDGNAADAVISINSLDDYRAFRTRLDEHSRILIMGAGLIGCEFANDLIATGHTVTLVDPAPQPLGRLLPTQAAATLREALEVAGVAFCMGSTVQRIDQTGDALTATLSGDDKRLPDDAEAGGDASGQKIEVDIVISAIGLKPDLDLAESAGLSCGRGIIVDRQLRTSEPSIFALGDGCEINGLVLPYVAPITHAARTLAAVLAGESVELTYPPMPVIVKTPACPTIVCPPLEPGEWAVEGTAPDLVCRCHDEAGNLSGFALTGATTRKRMELTRELPPMLGETSAVGG